MYSLKISVSFQSDDWILKGFCYFCKKLLMNIGFIIVIVASLLFFVNLYYLERSLDKDCEETFREAERINKEVDKIIGRN